MGPELARDKADSRERAAALGDSNQVLDRVLRALHHHVGGEEPHHTVTW